MQEKTRGIVLRVLRYSDQAIIVDIYTELRGCLSFWVKSTASRKASVKNMFFTPLSMLELNYDFKPAASMQRIRDVRFAYVYSTLPFEPMKAAVGLFLSDFLYRVLKQETANRPLFAYLDYSLQWFDRSESSYANFHLVFITRLTRFLGFYPNVEAYHKGDYFDMLNACFVSSRPMHAAYLGPEEAATIPMFMRMNYDSMRFFVMNRISRARYIEVINDYYRLHIPDFPELKSLDVLKELFE